VYSKLLRSLSHEYTSRKAEGYCDGRQDRLLRCIKWLEKVMSEE
jgi:hypothetical protein